MSFLFRRAKHLCFLLLPEAVMVAQQLCKSFLLLGKCKYLFLQNPDLNIAEVSTYLWNMTYWIPKAC